MRRIFLLALACLPFAGMAIRPAAAAPAEPKATPPSLCAGTATGARIVVALAPHRLALCEGRRAVATFGVRLGRGGWGKTREGDGKTPVGSYPLGEPRASERYGTFIPIGYPTAAQKAAGFTGSAVGVHGPGRAVKWLGRLVNAFDLSDGCVGLATDAEIERIATWVRAARPRTIELR